MGAALNLTPVYGRSPKGTRAYGEKPTSPGTRISTLGAMTMNAMCSAMCFEGTLNGHVFLFFLKHFLCPLLRPGHIVIMDNATAHLVEGVRELHTKAKARVCSICRLILLISIPLNWPGPKSSTIYVKRERALSMHFIRRFLKPLIPSPQTMPLAFLSTQELASIK